MNDPSNLKYSCAGESPDDVDDEDSDVVSPAKIQRFIADLRADRVSRVVERVEDGDSLSEDDREYIAWILKAFRATLRVQADLPDRLVREIFFSANDLPRRTTEVVRRSRDFFAERYANDIGILLACQKELEKRR